MLISARGDFSNQSIFALFTLLLQIISLLVRTVGISQKVQSQAELCFLGEREGKREGMSQRQEDKGTSSEIRHS